MSETSRRLATVRRVDALEPIPDAAAIDVAAIGGWRVVVRKDEFVVGQHVAFLEIDSWVPKAVAPFLCKEGRSRVYEGVEGERLKTKRLRGVVSQGLVLPLSVMQDGYFTLRLGDDLTERLGVIKYEKPIPGERNGFLGRPRGNFPSFVPKTDEERVQNLKGDVALWSGSGFEWQCTEKLDGSSMTVYFDADGVFHVCSRNLDIASDSGGAFWQCAREQELEDRSRRMQTDPYGNLRAKYAVQGELIGPGVQGNKYKLDSLQFRAFGMYDLIEKTRVVPGLCDFLCHLYGIGHVPVVCERMRLPLDVATILAMAEEGRSALADVMREGLVFKSLIPEIGHHFKAISSQWLLKYDE